MIPILYNYNETAFTTNGLGRLSDCISCKVTEERNGRYDMEFTYPVNGIHFDEILEGRYVAVTHDDNGDVQPFIIWQSSKPIDGVVTFTGYHVSYWLGKVLSTFSDYQTDTCQQVLDGLEREGSGVTTLWNFTTDITATTTNFGYNADGEELPPSTVRERLGGSEGSVLDRFGGEFEWDKWNVILHRSRGANNGVHIMYGKNLTDFKAETDASGMVNSVVGYYTGDYLITIPGWGTQKAHGTVYAAYNSSDQLPGGQYATKVVDFTDKIPNGAALEVANLQTRLTALARAYYEDNDLFDPSVGFDVDFVHLWQTEEYREFAPLQKCKLCDTVNVSFPWYGIRDQAIKIVAVEWDALADRYTKMTLGGQSTTLAEAITGGLSASVEANADAVRQTRLAIPTKTSDLTNDSGFLNAPSLESATILSPYSGSLNYLKLGRIVIFDGTIAANGVLSNGATLANGLPANHTNNSLFFALNNNSTSETVGMYISNDGSLKVRGSLASSNRSFRISGAYIAAS